MKRCEFRKDLSSLDLNIIGCSGIQQSPDRAFWWIENFTDAIYILDLDGNVIDVNQVTQDLTEYDKNALVQTNINQFNASPSINHPIQTMKRKLLDRGFILFEMIHKSKSGRCFPVEISMKLIEYRGQNRVICLVRDITERKLIEAALRQSEENFRNIFNSAADVIFICNLNGEFIEFNQEACTRLEYSQSEFYKKKIQEVFSSKAMPVNDSVLQDIMNKGSVTFDSEYTTKSGKVFPVSINARLIDFRGEKGILAIVRDITERKKFESALQQSEQRFRTIFDYSADAIFIHDSSGNIIETNKVCCHRLGYTKAEFMKMKVQDIETPHFSALLPDRMKVLFERDSSLFESVHRSKAGDVIPVEVNARIIDFQGKKLIMQIARDITERKIAEKQLREREEQLLQAQKMEAVGRLAGGIAHDFNNLLTVVHGYSEFLLESLPLNSPMRKDVQEIKNAAHSAVILTQQLLAFSRKQVLQMKSISLNEILLRMKSMIAGIVGEHIDIIMHLDPDIGLIKADSAQMEQILLNLITFAKESMPKGGSLRFDTAKICFSEDYTKTVTDIEPGIYNLLMITDTGVGMDEYTQNRLFEPFFSPKDRERGTGLGLSIVYGIIKQSGGKIQVESVLNQGTTFRIFFPITHEAQEVQTIFETDSSEIAQLRGHETILLVEDELKVREFAKLVLQRYMYKVLDAESGLSALKLYEQNPTAINLVITDLLMPHMSGKELVQQLHLRDPTLKVIFISGYGHDVISNNGVLEPGIIFLQKPFHSKALVKKVRDLLDK